jgi:hypothetical protein
LSALIPLRAEIAGGDHRGLYLAWLGCVQEQALDNTRLGPPVPPGLGKLTAAQKAFADFLRIDVDLMAVASRHSSKAPDGDSRKAVERWVASLPESQKAQWLTRMALGDDSHVRAELQRLFQQGPRARHIGGVKHQQRVGDLLTALETRKEQQRRDSLERAASEKAQRQKLDVLARERYLTNLAKREPAVWRQVETLITSRRPAAYDEAAKLLTDLRDVGIQQDRAGEIDAQIRRLSEQHAKKESLLSRLRRAGLV